MNRISKLFVAAVAAGAIALAIVATTSRVPPLIASGEYMGAAPSTSSPMTVTTTSQAYFVPLGYIRLTCTSPTYYSVESSSAGTATTSDALAPGPVTVNNVTITRSVWVNITSSQYLALLLKSGVQGYCIAEQGSVDGVTGSFTDLTVSGTLGVTGVSTLVGGSVLQGITKTGVLDAGATIVNGTFNVTGVEVHTGATVQHDGTVKMGLVDAGTVAITTLLNLAGDNLTVSTKTAACVALNNASPSIATATVNTGAKCVCSNASTQTNPVKCAVSGTTLTITGPNTTTDNVCYHCFQ